MRNRGRWIACLAVPSVAGPALLVLLAVATPPQSREPGPPGTAVAAPGPPGRGRPPGPGGLPGPGLKPRYTLGGGHGYSHVTAVAFGPDGRALAAGSSESTVVVWDLPPPDKSGG